jgi:hypothetical protein
MIRTESAAEAEMSNEIVLENQKQGNPESEWGLHNLVAMDCSACGACSGGGNCVLQVPEANIEGFTTDISADQGGTVEFKIATDSDHYRVDIYRLGYYDGDGARKVASFEHVGDVNQPTPILIEDTATVDAGNWSVTDTWTVPEDAVSGVYIAKLVRLDGTEGENHIPFVVRDDDGGSDIVFQTSDTTWQAYNDWGGASLYVNTLGNGDPRGTAVSYNRPVQTSGINSVLGVEYTAIRWLEQNGYDVSYMAGVDTARSGDELLEHDLFLSVGHDEYWSIEQRANVEAARDAGVNLAFWSGNEVYWRTRYEASADSTPDDYRTMVSYKESKPDSPADPSDEWTGTWRDWQAKNPNGPEPENSLTGTIFMVNGVRGDTISVSSDYSKLRFWDNTDIANLAPGQSIQLAPGTLGYEWDSDLDNGFRPAGLINLSSTTVDVHALVTGPADAPGWQGPGTATHSLTLYRAPSGALVFGAGSVFWAWGLDSDNPGDVPADPNVQQSMINLLAEMGIQPETIKEGLVHGTQSTDFVAPETQVTAVAGTARVGSKVSVLGTADDFGGGEVAGVEFSSDGGLTWRKASGTDDWSYGWTPDRVGLVTIEARSVDDSLNLGAAGDPLTVYVRFANAGFDPGYYLDTNLDVKSAGIDPYKHYTKYGVLEGRNPSEDFSTKEYLAANPDIAKSGINPLTHFEKYGWKEGRDPSADFDVEWYLLHNPDVKASGMNPLDHYILFGKAEGRETHAAIGNIKAGVGFDAQYYYWQNPDVAAAKVDAYKHYLKFGIAEGRDPNAYFDSDAYLAANPDVAAAGMNPLQHFEKYGWKEGRDPSADFDVDAYLAANPDVAAAGINPLDHYLKYGIYEGRDPHGLVT